MKLLRILLAIFLLIILILSILNIDYFLEKCFVLSIVKIKEDSAAAEIWMMWRVLYGDDNKQEYAIKIVPRLQIEHNQLLLKKIISKIDKNESYICTWKNNNLMLHDERFDFFNVAYRKMFFFVFNLSIVIAIFNIIGGLLEMNKKNIRTENISTI